MITQTDSTKVTFTQVYQDVKEGLTALGESLKVGAEHVYEVLIRQQVVNSITYLIMILLSFVMMYSFYVGAKNKKEQWTKDYGDPTPIAIFRVICMVLGSVCFLFGIIHIDVIITGFVNPEYGAMKEIMNFVK